MFQNRIRPLWQGLTKIAILMICSLVLLSACGSETNGTENPQDNTEAVAADQAPEASPSTEATPTPTKENIDQLNNGPLPKSAAKVDWEGMFLFDNPGGKAGKNLLGNELELEINADGSGELGIFSKSMATPHAILKIKTKGRGPTCRVVYSEYVKGNGWEDLEVGSVLFTLEENEEGLLTTWGSWKPLYGDLPNEGNYFQRQNQ